MNQEELNNFQQFLISFTKKNGKKLGERTIHGILTLAKFVETSKQGESLENLALKHKTYLDSRNYPIAKYSLWLYLKSLNYTDKFIKEMISFRKRNLTALNDEERLAESVLTKKELLFLVNSIPNIRDKLIVKILYDTGARVSEITNLKLKDIDLDTKEIQVMGKGRKPRTVYIHSSTTELLKVFIQTENILSPNVEVFRITPMTVWYNLKKYGRELLNRELHPHMLRHSRLQHMADEGIDSFSIKSYAGHADIGTTQIYVKASKYQGKLAFEKAGDIWEKK
ncbi:MAG: tyrosine-type recombinase/integrase [Nanoarchaeota archaeon]